ncbi:MAG: hypothetical protein AB1348_08155 [Nitrospirota bacterium]
MDHGIVWQQSTISLKIMAKTEANSTDPNPCEACHNVHISQRIGAKQYHRPYDSNKSPIQRVTEHNNPTKRLNLRGDETTERMLYYVQTNGGYYQAPYYGNTSGNSV